MRYILAFLLLIISFACEAQTSIQLNGISIHQKSGYNGINLGLGIEQKITPNISGAIGFYENSIDNKSVYLLVKYEIFQYNDFKVNFQLGGVTGYKNNFVPVFLPEICKNIICGTIVPPINDVVVGAAAIYLKIPIDKIGNFKKK